MNPTDIFGALEAIANAPFDPSEFGFSFAEATDNAQATVSKLRGGSLNRSALEGGVLMNLKFHYAPVDALGVEVRRLARLSGDSRRARMKKWEASATAAKSLDGPGPYADPLEREVCLRPRHEVEIGMFAQDPWRNSSEWLPLPDLEDRRHRVLLAEEDEGIRRKRQFTNRV